MEGRKHAGVVITCVTNADAAQGRAWEEKWRTQRVPPAVESGSVDHGVAFRVASGYDLGGATHVAIYETTQQDVAAAAQKVGEGDGERTASYTKFAEHGPVSEGRTAGVVLVFTDCDDPAVEDEYNDWYTGHLRHTIESIDFYAATRYVSDDPSRTPSKYLAIYETQNADPAQVQKDGVEWWVKGNFEGFAAMLLRAEVPIERID